MSKRTTKLPESVAISSVKLSPDALDQMLDDLDANNVIPTINYRKDGRVSCRCTVVIVVVNQRGYESTFIIPVRDLSSGGIAFLHRSMLHKGTQCTIRLRTPDLHWLQVRGRVVRSRYIRDMIYEVGLKFSESVDLAKYGMLGETVPSSAPNTVGVGAE
jgi:hypothetical protein